MKKTTLLFLLISIICFGELNAQVDQYYAINGLATSGNGRAPQGSRNVTRSVWLITAAEMTAGGFINGDVITGLGFTYLTPQNITTTGTFVAYLQNTADATNTKTTPWATAIAGMTTVSNGTITLPNTAGEFNYTFTGGSSFTYTGGALYVAYDYQNLSNPVATTANVAYCNTALTGGILTGLSAVGVMTPPTAITASNFRPATRLGKNVACARPYNLFSNVTTNTTTTALLSYIASGGPNVEIEYGVYDYTQGTGTTIPTSTNPHTITGLTPSTVYDVYMRTNCGAGFSAWNGPYSLNTVFDPATPPYTTSFEQENFPFIGWKLESGTPAASNWQTGFFGPPSGTNTLTQDGSTSVYSLSGVTTAAANNFVISRGINLTAGSNVTISFFARNYQAVGSTGTSSYNVTVGTSQTAAAQTTNVGTETGLSVLTWAQKTYNYVTPTTGTYYFGVQNISPANTVGQQAIFIDNLNITEVLSTTDFLASKLAVYPNPAKDLVTISNDSSIVVSTIQITDLNGRVVKNQNINAIQGQVSIGDLSTGVYMMKIATDQGTVTKKIVKN